MSASRYLQVEQDDFLSPAPLFRFGPWALMLVGLLLSVSVLIAARWRIDIGRQGEYEKAFHFASATETAIHASTTHVFALLEQTTASLRVALHGPNPIAAVQERLATPLDLQGGNVHVMVLDAKGQILGSTPGHPIDPADLGQFWSSPPRRGTTVSAVLHAVKLSGADRQAIPVLFQLSGQDNAATVAYLVDTGIFASVFLGMLGDKPGWLRLDDRQGNKVTEVHRSVPPEHTDDQAIAAAARSPAQAMESQVDYSSQRLVLASRAGGSSPLVASVGLIEADVLKELHHRVSATWLIFGISMAVVMGLVTITSVALRKFAIKESHLRRLATVDILTGLPNRRSFHHLLTRAVQSATKQRQMFGLMFVDLDNFKDVNDSLGHEAGDQLLKRVGELLVRAVRQGDCVCRLGGDEFTVMLADLRDAGEAQAVGQRVLEMLAQPLRINDLDVRTRATIGIALLPQHATTVSDLMRFADTAMYRAKQDGKSICLIYDESMAAQALFKAKRVEELTHAIRQDELFLEYQPKFCLRTGKVTGYEALVRWQHPTRGLIGPASFISLAEEAGLIVDLGQWVLERAVRQLREWHDLGAGWLHVAVNVSALQLRSGRFPICVQQALARHGVPGSHLQLELTESSLVIDAEQARELVHQVHAMGSSVAVDDFGTGYSSLAALQQFNIDYLKIDRGFVKAIETPNGEEICRTVVNLAHGLNMRAVAEGVETSIQRDILRRLGCDEVQGFLYARPMPAGDVLLRVRPAVIEPEMA
jgi:diguanylate cyclase (GGDEF)-like protein